MTMFPRKLGTEECLEEGIKLVQKYDHVEPDMEIFLKMQKLAEKIFLKLSINLGMVLFGKRSKENGLKKIVFQIIKV